MGRIDLGSLGSLSGAFKMVTSVPVFHWSGKYPICRQVVRSFARKVARISTVSFRMRPWVASLVLNLHQGPCDIYFRNFNFYGIVNQDRCRLFSGDVLVRGVFLRFFIRQEHI